MATVAVVPRSFQEPTLRAQARSRAQEIVDDARTRVEEITHGATARRRLAALLEQSEAELARRLHTLRRAGKGDTWTAYDTAVALAQTREVLGSMGPRFAAMLAKNAIECRKLGVGSVVEMLAHFETRAGGRREGGVLRPLALREALALDAPVLARHATSVDRYGDRMIRVIARELQIGMLRGQSWDQVTRRLVGMRGPSGARVSLAAVEVAPGVVERIRTESIPEGLFRRYPYFAERIVRTEGMAALSEGAMLEMREEKRQRFPDLKKRIIATFDARTAEDSRRVHGQVRELDGLFDDGVRQYAQPPNRPNDREVVISWREAWAER